MLNEGFYEKLASVFVRSIPEVISNQEFLNYMKQILMMELEKSTLIPQTF
jgi:hypothetical protein